MIKTKNRQILYLSVFYGKREEEVQREECRVQSEECRVQS